ncbi:hypothetical protein [Kiloniella sp. b19]|uniref:hypothetical protein n=1 Tax=Kiloniella sp. GXU_MW_B19 TaxID=3141326 RepID=UPI0031E13830
MEPPQLDFQVVLGQLWHIIQTIFTYISGFISSVNWEKIIIAGMEHTAWPIVTVVVASWFKGEIAILLNRLKSFKAKDFSLEFKEVTEAAKPIESTIQHFMPSYDDDIFMIATIRPTAAITETWKELEASMLRLLPANSHQTKQGRRQLSGFNIIRELKEKGHISADETRLLQELRQFRNRAAHSVDRDVPPTEAREYVKLALSLSRKLDELQASN